MEGSVLLLTALLAVLMNDGCSLAALDDTDATDVQYTLRTSSPSPFEIGHNSSLKIYTKPALPDDVSLLVDIHLSDRHIMRLPSNVMLNGGNYTYIHMHGMRAGTVELSFNITPDDPNITFPKLNKVKREVSVIHFKALDIFSIVVGWIYFAAWSISFYPQIFDNFWRRSVVGLNFDYLALNITGFVSYLVFNVGLFWIPSVQSEYKSRHPGGVNPVQINDVVFTIHAVAATGFTIFQCFIFERGKQRVSYIAWAILVVLWLTVFITLFVSVGGKLAWLDFLYVFSYVKLAVTLIKYVPQAIMNCRRRSTVGWSIGNVLLDFTGGALSLLQMFIISYNYNDWKSIFGDPTKFGLGAFSILFDLFFMFQHYCLFWGRKPRDEEEVGYKKIEEKCPTGGLGVKEVGADDSSDEEDSPLLGDKEKQTSGSFTRVFNFCYSK